MSGPQESPEDIKKDIIAGASLSKCKTLARELLRLRSFDFDPRNYQNTEIKYLDCMNEYANTFNTWATARTANNDVYYFNREKGTSQWTRPEQMERDIQAGKLATDHTEPWMECEFIHLQLVQCEKSIKNETKGCNEEFEKLRKCVQSRAGGNIPQ